MKQILYIQLYSLYFYSLLTMFFPRIISYSEFATIVSAFASITIAKYFIQHKRISKLFLLTFLIGVGIILLYLSEMVASINENTLQYTFFLVVLGQTFPAVLVAALVSTEKDEESGLERRLMLFVIVFSFLVLNAILNPNIYTRGGGFTTEFVLNYQNGSYLCAYISNFIIYLFLIGNIGSNLKKLFYIIALTFVTFALFIMGGKGGFVTYVIINSLLISFIIKRNISFGSNFLRNFFS